MAVITLVTLAIGRSVSMSRPHSTWPVAASASTAPLAFTPPGAPATAIIGLADGRGRDGVDGARVRAAAAACAGTGRGPCPAPVDVHAATPPVMAATAVSKTIHTLSRMTPALATSQEIPSTGKKRPPGSLGFRPDLPSTPTALPWPAPLIIAVLDSFRSGRRGTLRRVNHRLLLRSEGDGLLVGHAGCDQVPDSGSRHRRCRLFQPVKRSAAVTVAGVRVCSVVDEYLDGPQEACPGGVVQRCRVESPDAGRTFRVTGTAIGCAGTVVQEGADILRIVLATLVSR